MAGDEDEIERSVIASTVFHRAKQVVAELRREGFEEDDVLSITLAAHAVAMAEQIGRSGCKDREAVVRHGCGIAANRLPSITMEMVQHELWK